MNPFWVVRTLADRFAGRLHTSVGRIRVAPNSANVVPDRVEIAAELKWWRETNSAGIRELWAISKSDGLGVNKLYEDRLKALAG